MGDFYLVALLLCRAAACALSRVVIHQAPIAAWRTTAGHNATPCSPKPMPVKARTAVAAMLYISIATTNPLAAQLRSSSRASQQATPSARSARPHDRASLWQRCPILNRPEAPPLPRGNTAERDPLPVQLPRSRCTDFSWTKNC